MSKWGGGEIEGYSEHYHKMRNELVQMAAQQVSDRLNDYIK